MRKRLVSLLFAGIMACSVIGSGVTTLQPKMTVTLIWHFFTYIEGMDLQQTGADGILHAVV